MTHLHETLFVKPIKSIEPISPVTFDDIVTTSQQDLARRRPVMLPRVGHGRRRPRRKGEA
jgi:hypothetical protein